MKTTMGGGHPLNGYEEPPTSGKAVLAKDIPVSDVPR